MMRPRASVIVCVSDFLDRSGQIPRRVRPFRKFLFHGEEVLRSAAWRREGSQELAAGEGAAEAWRSRAPLQVLLPPERAPGTHQISLSPRACNGLTPHALPTAAAPMVTLGSEPAAVWPGPPGPAQHCLKMSPLEELRGPTGTHLGASTCRRDTVSASLYCASVSL